VRLKQASNKESQHNKDRKGNPTLSDLFANAESRQIQQISPRSWISYLKDGDKITDRINIAPKTRHIKQKSIET
jgi:hypothetical protein